MEHFIVGHDRLGPMLLREMEFQEIQIGMRDFESYDDILEEDDTTVFE